MTGQGFKLNIHDSGSGLSPRRVTFLHRNDSFSLHYPLAPLSVYGPHEAFFILGSPPIGNRFNVTVLDVNTEANYDVVTFMGLEGHRDDNAAPYFR